MPSVHKPLRKPWDLFSEFYDMSFMSLSPCDKQNWFHCWSYSISCPFRFDRNDSVLYVLPLSRVQVVCPNPSTVMKKVKVDSTEKEYQNLWIVSRESYERCSTDKSQGSKLLLRCDTPLSLKYLTLLFQRYSAVYDFGYIPGQEYYFIGMLI